MKYFNVISMFFFPFLILENIIGNWHQFGLDGSTLFIQSDIHFQVISEFVAQRQMTESVPFIQLSIQVRKKVADMIGNWTSRVVIDLQSGFFIRDE